VSDFEVFLGERLREIQRQNLYRRLRNVSSAQGARITIDGREVLHFSSNDYLGLAAHPRLKEAAIKATEHFGAGSGASRLISGSLRPHQELEECIARFKGTEAALAFSSGYATALGTITALLSRNDFIVLDKLVHASIVDAARLSGAKLRVFAHNDLNDLEEILRWCSGKRAAESNVLIITESLFSMDGDFAPLREIVALKEAHGAWLMVDEAHAAGLFGANRRGLIEERNVAGQVEIQMGTLGKAVGSSGGYICGSRGLIELLINKARSLIFSTAPPPSASAAAQAGLAIIGSSEGQMLLDRLRSNISAFHSGASPIVPIIVGGEVEALKLSEELMNDGIFVPAIRYPTVPRDQARLRISFSASHSAEDARRLAQLLGEHCLPRENRNAPAIPA
jgi:8-amino-7-oxononanoate synthase